MPLHPSRMPPIRTAGEMVDDKCAIDAGHAQQVMTYTFLNEIPPPLVETESADFIVRDSSPPSTPQRTSHNKRRDASYIPRPPNAFILFRSSFIRDQKVSNKVEGNHSKLSKIIGMYWKALTKEQRDEWEAKAAQALIEHRKRYPDWRFRHAANTGANVESKIKIKDGARRGRARKDPPDKVGGGAEDDSEDGPRAEEEASRLTKIAGLLSEGQEGEALERAVEEWEAERRLIRRSASVSTQDSASSSPVITRASASADRDQTPSTLTLVLSPLSSVSASHSPVVTRACASSSTDQPLPTASESPSLSPSLSVASPVITRASSTQRKPYPDSPTPVSRPPSSLSAPRLSVLTSTYASGSLLKPWPASPVTPPSTASRPRPLPWPPSPATPRTQTWSSFSVFSPEERWELEHRLARSKASSSPGASSLTAAGELSTFMTSASCSELTPQPLTVAPASMLSPSVSVSASPSPSRASTMKRETQAPSLLSCFDTSISNAVLSLSSPRTPRTLPCTPSRPVPIPTPRWPRSPMTPHAASTSAPWPTSPRISTSFPAYMRAEEWEASLHANRSNSIPKSALSSPLLARASVSDSALAVALEQIPSSPSHAYAPSSPTMPTATPPVPIPRFPPSWPASPSTSASTPADWPPSPLIPCSASFPAFRRAEDWELGLGSKARSNSASVLSSPIMIHTCASASMTDRETPTPTPYRSPPVSSPLLARTPVSTPSWPASPSAASALSSPIAARTPVATPSWSNAPSPQTTTTHPPNATHTPPSESASESPATATPTLSRRSRPQSRSPTQRSPQNPSVLCAGTKRSLSAPAPKGRHHHWWQQPQESARMDAGFWWPTPHEQGDCRDGREHEPEQEQEQEQKQGMEMPGQLQVAVPTRDGSFDFFTSQDRETEPEFDFVGSEGERGWNWSDFGYDSKSTSVYSSVSAPDENAVANHLRCELTPAHERWFNPWDADTTVHAGESLHPLPPTPISPTSPIASPLSLSPFVSSPFAHTPSSSFSSLAGWDGTSSEPANANSDSNHTPSAGTCAAVKASVAGIAGIGWGRSGLQTLGVQGGGYGVDCQWVG